MGEKQWKKNLDQFLTLNLDQFLTLKPPNHGPVFNFTAKNYENSGFSRSCPKPKMTLFSEKGVFGMGEKVVSTNCVFEKLCSSENTVL